MARVKIEIEIEQVQSQKRLLAEVLYKVIASVLNACEEHSQKNQRTLMNALNKLAGAIDGLKNTDMSALEHISANQSVLRLHDYLEVFMKEAADTISNKFKIIIKHSPLPDDQPQLNKKLDNLINLLDVKKVKVQMEEV